ncbi:MAG: hypothetical protein J0H91_21525 [Rhodospirillales bacterium]|nr:hypothetical protein [Rhodospirillales bacterium]
MYRRILALGLLAAGMGASGAAAQALCIGFGPQAPRDISSPAGSNAQVFTPAPPYRQMNLCNLHTHTNAEHKGPGFSVFAGAGKYGGYQCNETASLTKTELEDPAHGHGAFHGVKPGDTIEVHWVYTSCMVPPGEGLGACMSTTCQNPELRVETQVFLVVNDKNALDFNDFTNASQMVNGHYQAKSLPTGTGTPVVYAGSTTGSDYTQSACSPLQVTWSVRSRCARLDIGSLNRWAEAGNVFKESHSHGVRQLVTAPALLAPIE